MRLCLLAGLLMLLLPARAPAQQVPTASAPADIADAALADTPPDDMPIIDMDAVVVSGQQPGPGMWKVSKGDHVLYILGTLSPLPRRMQWIPDDVQETIAQAQAVIDPPSVKVDSDIGLFRRMFLLPSLLKARRNPDGRTLQQVVAPELYARWSVLKPRYIGNDAGIEKWRPIFAAQALYEAAMRKSGLSQKSVVQPVVEAAARKYRVPRISTLTTFMVKNPKAAIREFQATALADKDCFAKTMVRIETDLDGMRARANAWAVGDVEALRDRSHEDQYVVCTRAITDSALAQKLGLGNVRGRVADTWLAAAEGALARNRVSFATLPISLLLRPDGFMARLRAKGYVVEEP